MVLPLACLLLAQAPALSVEGDVPKPETFTVAQLQALGPPQKASWKNHGQVHSVEGVALDALLTRAGFDPGAMGPDVPKDKKRAGWKKAVIATAADGYEAVFSCAEVMPAMGPTKVLVVWSLDDKPLPADAGPLRLVSLTDLEGARSIHSLRKLTVVDVRRAVGRTAP